MTCFWFCSHHSHDTFLRANPHKTQIEFGYNFVLYGFVFLNFFFCYVLLISINQITIDVTSIEKNTIADSVDGIVGKVQFLLEFIRAFFYHFYFFNKYFTFQMDTDDALTNDTDALNIDKKGDGCFGFSFIVKITGIEMFFF